MRTLVFVFSLLLSLLVPNLASAQSFGNHYDQTTQTLNAGQIIYLAIPRQGWPVHVQISVIELASGTVQVGPTSFTIVDGVGNPSMTVPESVAGQPASSCGGTSIVGAAIECQVSNSVLLIGYMDSSSDQPHKMFLLLNACGCTLQARITMWY